MHYLSIGLHFLYFFLGICEMGVKETCVTCVTHLCDYQLGNSPGILIHLLVMNPGSTNQNFDHSHIN